MKSCIGQGLEGLQMQSPHAFSSWGQGASLLARQCVHQPGRALLARVCLFDFFMLLQLFLLFLPFPTSTQGHPFSSLSQSPNRCLCPWVMHKCSVVNPFTIFHPVPPSPSVVSLFHVSIFCFCFVCLLCSLDSRYNWDHVVFVSLSLDYFT